MMKSRIHLLCRKFRIVENETQICESNIKNMIIKEKKHLYISTYKFLLWRESFE